MDYLTVKVMEDSGRKKTTRDQICPIYFNHFEAQQLEKELV